MTVYRREAKLSFHLITILSSDSELRASTFMSLEMRNIHIFIFHAKSTALCSNTLFDVHSRLILFAFFCAISISFFCKYLVEPPITLFQRCIEQVSLLTVGVLTVASYDIHREGITSQWDFYCRRTQSSWKTFERFSFWTRKKCLQNVCRNAWKNITCETQHMQRVCLSHARMEFTLLSPIGHDWNVLSTERHFKAPVQTR